MMFFPYYPPFLSVMAVIAPGFMVSLPNIRAVSGDAAFRYCRSSCFIGMEDSPIGHSGFLFYLFSAWYYFPIGEIPFSLL